MENNILIELTKRLNSGYEKISIYKDGTVEFETLKDETISKRYNTISIINDLEIQLQNASIIMNLIYTQKENTTYKIVYNNQIFYSFDLYIDICMMIKSNQIRKMTVFSQYEKIKKEEEKKKQIAQDIIILDEMEKNKKQIDISDVETETFDNEREIISFKLGKKQNFELGESRFFSDTIDVSDSIQVPNELLFVGQLNLNEISIYDTRKMLPQTGMLYFFQSPNECDERFYDFGKVIYSEDMNLKRKQIEVKEKNEHMILNLSLKEVSNNIENFNKRYYYDAGEYSYNSFYAEELNKIYGFYTDCQMDEEDIKKVSLKYIVLLQLGSDIYGEGITTFLISEDDLKNKTFDNIIFTYVQS